MISSFRTAPEYRSNALAYRVSDTELRHYKDERWAAVPKKLIADALAQYLRASGLFSAVRVADVTPQSGLSLSGRVVAIEQVNNLHPKLWHARLAIEVVVRDADSDRVLFKQLFDETRPCSKNEPAAVAEVIRQILSAQCARLIQRLKTAK